MKYWMIFKYLRYEKSINKYKKMEKNEDDLCVDVKILDKFDILTR